MTKILYEIPKSLDIRAKVLAKFREAFPNPDSDTRKLPNLRVAGVKTKEWLATSHQVAAT